MCALLFSAGPLEAGWRSLQRKHLAQPWEMCFQSIRGNYISKLQFCFTNMIHAENKYLLSEDLTLIFRAQRLELSHSSRTVLLRIT